MASPRTVNDTSPFHSNQRVVLKREDKRAEMLISQVSATNLRRVFHVDPATVWLQDDIDDTAFFPTEEGMFTGLRCSQALYVEGPPARPPQASVPTGSGSSTLSSTQAPPQFRSVVPAARKGSPINGNCRVKIIKAEMHWNTKTNKPSFIPSHQSYVEVQESTATVEYIRDDIRRKWGDSYILVTNDGLELENCSATQGLFIIT